MHWCEHVVDAIRLEQHGATVAETDDGDQWSIFAIINGWLDDSTGEGGPCLRRVHLLVKLTNGFDDVLILERGILQRLPQAIGSQELTQRL